MMIKYLFLFIVGLFVLNVAFAQKDTAVYYLKASGKLVSTKDSADYFVVILPPDTSIDKNLFIVKEFYSNGQKRLFGNSTTNTLNLEFQGSQIVFFPNGHRLRISNYVDGRPSGDVTEYYPNGKLYNTQTITSDKHVLLNGCRDSTGTVLAENGKGKWIKFYDESFNNTYSEGKIENGLEEGEWVGTQNNKKIFTYQYKKGVKVSLKIYDEKRI